jgi:hypothetical protein
VQTVGPVFFKPIFFKYAVTLYETQCAAHPRTVNAASATLPKDLELEFFMNKVFFVSLLILFTVEASSLSHACAADAPATSAATGQSFLGAKSKWNGFDMYKQGRNIIIAPAKAAEGKPWLWRARFFGHQPQFDIAMLGKGYHVVYCDVSGLYGAPSAVKRWDAFYKMLHEKHGFAKKAVLEGMSRGGLIIYNWAAANPEKVAAIYGDAPVMDFKSWPGAGNGGILKAYGFKDVEQAKAYKYNPVDNLKPLAKAGIAIIHVVGDLDKVVPIAANTTLAQKRYKELGGVFEVIHKQVGHHPHSLKDPAPLVKFMEKHAAGKKRK